MKGTIFIACLLQTFILIPGAADAAGLYKCVDTQGHISYQDVNCGPHQTRSAISNHIANWLPMGVSRDDARLVSSFEAQQKKAHELRLKRIGDSLRQMQKQAQRCKSLKARYYRLEDRHTTKPIPNRGTRSQLLDRMLKACSS